MTTSKPILLIHGGCGLIERKHMTQEYEKECRDGLTKSLRVGFEILKSGGSALDAVVASIAVMEDDELFNAGKGSVFTSSGTNELDAGVMDGSNGRAGGCSTVKCVKNPIRLARAIMDHTPHTVLNGAGADEFARSQRGSSIEIVEPSYFYVQRRFEQLEKYLKKAHAQSSTKIAEPQLDHDIPTRSSDTVGAVALDSHGRLASGSSSGGLTGKLVGRQSDSSIPGAGFWADTRGAFSITGHGDHFLRRAASHEMAALVRYRGSSVKEAAEKVIEEIGSSECSIGVIAVDPQGEFCMPYNSEGMFRGYIRGDEDLAVQIWEY